MPLSEKPLDSNKNGYFYYRCDCCPYGYHIDLDFVRYCETIGHQTERSASIKRRKDRRRQRQSMEVLLGLDFPQTPNLSESVNQFDLEPLRCASLHKHKTSRGVSDLDQIMVRSKNGLSHNLPDVTAVSGDPSSNRDYDTISLESYCMSPITLENIREQMVLGLKRTKELEEMVKLVPTLEAQLVKMESENKFLQAQLANLEQINNRLNSQSTTSEKLHASPECTSASLRREFGVMATVRTRNIGVGNLTCSQKTVSTTTKPIDTYVDRWFSEKNKFMNEDDIKARTMRDSSCQTQFVLEKKSKIVSSSTQTVHNFANKAVNTNCITLSSMDACTQSNVDTHTVGISDNSLTDEYCTKCDHNKMDTHKEVSLASLSLSQTNLLKTEDVQLNKKSMKTIALQCDSLLHRSHKSSQSDKVIASSKASQHEIVYKPIGVQFEPYENFSKSTDTHGLISTIEQGTCTFLNGKRETSEVGCNTSQLSLVNHTSTGKAINAITPPHDLCSIKQLDDTMTASSKIPRPQVVSENRKFKHSDVSTNSEPTRSPLKTFESHVMKSDSDHKTPVKKLDLALGMKSSSNNLNNEIGKELSPLSNENNTYSRQKCIPSKEMQGAMKVLNDSLQKNQTNPRPVRSAYGIIQSEWFTISSSLKAEREDVKDVLEHFDDISSVLLEYIVNMTDSNGNTAMHYAVSHGNFDVVSTLLDSEVCDINKQNKAGYTCVMLVSLSEIRSENHSDIIKRLFALADVNIRAKLHGQTALMLAVSHGNLEMVIMLLEAGADINMQDEDGSTALMCAAEHGHVDIVRHLLSQPNCDSGICDVDGSTALNIAMEAGYRHIGILLYAHEKNIQRLGTKEDHSEPLKKEESVIDSSKELSLAQLTSI